MPERKPIFFLKELIFQFCEIGSFLVNSIFYSKKCKFDLSLNSTHLEKDILVIERLHSKDLNAFPKSISFTQSY
jgi:hypothetical protein